MKVLHLNSVLSAGRYKGMTVGVVLKKDPEHILDLLETYDDVILGDDVRDALPEDFENNAPKNEILWEEENEWDSDESDDEEWEEESDEDTEKSDETDDESVNIEDDSFLE